MERKSKEKRIEYFKQDGSDLFMEGDITGATEMYIAALRLDMDQHIQKLLTSKQTSKRDDCNNNTPEEIWKTKKSSTDGINSVITTVLHNAEEAIKINPSLSKPYKSKATALILQNKWDEAREVYLSGINLCDDCAELQKALQNLQKTQTILESIPQVLERTKSVSSDTSESTFDGRSPTSKARRFRLQHRKKLSRPMVGLETAKRLQYLKLSQEQDDVDVEQEMNTTPTLQKNETINK